MKKDLVNSLCCPECGGDIKVGTVVQSSSEEITEGFLLCDCCDCSYRILESIPILLPRKFSNAAECELRKNVSEQANGMINQWEKLYDAHHFKKLSRLRIKLQLQKLNLKVTPKILDVGIGWGANYLSLNRNVDLFGLDFSYESLLLLKRIYERAGEPVPNLICASLSAIPLKNIKFHLIWSTQVYQLVPDDKEIKISLDFIIQNLLSENGLFIIDSLSYNRLYFLNILKNILKPAAAKEKVNQVKHNNNLYIKYYTEKNLRELVEKLKPKVRHKIFFTENLFYPEFKGIFKSNFIAFIDYLIQKIPLAKFLGRQISLILRKERTINDN